MKEPRGFIIPLVSCFKNTHPSAKYNPEQLVRQELELGDSDIDNSSCHFLKFQSWLFNYPGDVP
jgi:hypothetical protein